MLDAKPDATALLRVHGLNKHFPTPKGTVRAVSDISFEIPRGSITGLVGESGSGKTTLGRTLLRLVEPTSGRTEFDGDDINEMDQRSLRELRRRAQIIFQDPVSSLNPRMRVGQIIGEGLVAHRIGTRGERDARIAALLSEVGLAADAASRYPHEFSGGQRQRIGIARALALDPEFILADECVSALDVSIQAQILNLLLDLRETRDLTMLFIAHDLSVVEYLCDQIIVMYLGRIVEIGPAREVYHAPRHPYTQALISAIPEPDPRAKRDRQVLSDDIPSPLDPPSGCVFRTRCPIADAACAATLPGPVAVGPSHHSYCLKSEETA
ncbi:ABC transporter ATP-binding protein [Paracoccus sp. MBLB3053]|uniref:ABC transporter ATP-binding protein n=1 Tax=Paracoccus aurantius TaxID=3073814 RepID=A0ABU2HWF5_9RHOB|nr:ABC transporter ATP-binding protein [Paracoccus sp. MBLB3053]MDS9469353.1 ABC transporter ATP-binding protein [Paracoccus sp. MBLB3053]